MTRALLVAIALVAGCSSSSEPRERFVAEPDGFSLMAPPSWQPHRDRGAVVFVSAAEPRRTLAVRSVVMGDPDAQKKALAATRTVVEHLPSVDVTATRPIEGALSGVVYELTFVPPGQRERYARTHAVLVGDQHIFHVIETRPVAGTRPDGTTEAVIASVREEG